MGRLFVFIGIILSTFFWGSNFNAGAFVVSHVSPMAGAAERFIIATSFILVYLFIKENNNITVLKHNFIPFVCLGLLGVAGFNLSLFVGLKTTTAINGALIMATTPITTTLLSSLLDKTKISVNQYIGIVISFIGVTFVISKGSFENISNLHFSIGDCIILIGSVFWASYTVGCKKYITNSSPLQTTSFTMLFGTIGIVISAQYNESIIETLSSAPLSVHVASVYMGIAGSVLAYLFWNVGLKKVGPANTSIFFNLVPVFTMVITAFNGVIPNEIQLIGAISVIAGVILSTGGYKLIINQLKPQVSV